MLRYRLFLEWLVMLAAALLLAGWSQYAGITDRLDARILDFSTGLTRPDPSSEIVIVAIDDPSLAAIGAWPWPRDVHARLIDTLSDAGAKRIIYDVLFLEQSNRDLDNQLAMAMAHADNVVLPYTFGTKTGEELSAADEVVPIYPIAELTKKARALGHVAATVDNDGILRRFELELRDRGTVHQQIMLAAYVSAQPADPVILDNRLSDHDNWPVAPFNPIGAFTTSSASEVLQGRVQPEFFADKWIIVGATAQGMGDRHSVAAGQIAIMPGVETQANLLNTLLNDSFVEEASDAWATLFACIAILIQFLAFWKLAPKYNFFATAIMFAFVPLAAVSIVVLANIWIAPGSAMLVLVLTYPLWSWRRLASVSAYLETEISNLPGLDGQADGETGFDVIARQVATMKSLVRNVSSSIQFLRQTIDAAPDPMFVLDRESKVTMWNAKAATLFPKWSLSVEPSFNELFIGAEVEIDTDAGEVVAGDGRTFLLARGALEGPDEPGGGQVIALRDISKLRHQEQEHREMLEFLSHDMRTPQVAIIGLTQRAGGSIGEAERLDRIRSQAERTLKLADDFVQLARLEETALSFEEADLVALVQESCDRAFSSARKKRIKLNQKHPDNPVYVEVEASLIARLLDNLLSNAIKFSPEESAISIEVGAPQNGMVPLKLADQGPGLPAERLEDPFARFGAHDSKAGPSVGLGLNFVQRTVHKHSGEIYVVSNPKTGTVFHLSLLQEQALL